MGRFPAPEREPGDEHLPRPLFRRDGAASPPAVGGERRSDGDACQPALETGPVADPESAASRRADAGRGLARRGDE
jgi:hypothetical protein